MEENSPQIQTRQNVSSQPETAKKKRRLLKILIFVLIALILSAAGVFAYRLYKERFVKKPSATSKPTPVIINPETKVEDSPNIPNWKVYSGNRYSISFPDNWEIKQAPSDTGFNEAIALISSSGVTSLQIGLQYDFPYGFGPEAKDHKKQTIKIRVGNKYYEGEETLYTGDKRVPYHSVFIRIVTEDTVASYINRASGEKDKQPFVFMFGNDYPLQNVRVFRLENPENALNQYEVDKDIILEILKSFAVKPELSWKVYKNEKLDYSIKYPTNWFLNDKEQPLGGYAPNTSQILLITTHKDLPGYQEGHLGESDDVRIYVNYTKNSEQRDIKDLNVPFGSADNPPENIAFSYLTINGLKARRYTYYPNNKWGSPGVYSDVQLKDGDFIGINGIIYRNFEEYLDIVTEIQDSFKQD